MGIKYNQRKNMEEYVFVVHRDYREQLMQHREVGVRVVGCFVSFERQIEALTSLDEKNAIINSVLGQKTIRDQKNQKP